MIIGMIGSDSEGWGTTQLRESFRNRGVSTTFMGFSELTARVSHAERAVVSVDEIDLVLDLSALIVRQIGKGSLEEIIFRMDVLHKLEREGLLVVNPPGAIERCVDKYYALVLLREEGLPVPHTVVTESIEKGLEAFRELGEDVVIKPLFGSRGVGLARICNADIATRIFNSVILYHGVLYLQEYIPHGNSDLRAFVVGDQVIAAMRRVGNSWKTNISQGGSARKVRLSAECEALAVDASKAVGCKVSGVDILESERGPLVIELNSQPGWKGLQSVIGISIADSITDYVLSETKR